MKKGFTLVEIIISITLILIISVAGVSLIITKKSSDFKEVEEQILDAARLYANIEVDANGENYIKGVSNYAKGVKIPIKSLYNDGYIDDKTIKSLEQKGYDSSYYVLLVEEETNGLCEDSAVFYLSWTMEEEHPIYLCNKKPGNIVTSEEGIYDINNTNLCIYDDKFSKESFACQILEKANNGGSTTFKEKTESPIGVNYEPGEIIKDETIYTASSNYTSVSSTGTRWYSLPHFPQDYGTSYIFDENTNSFSIPASSKVNDEYIATIYSKFKNGTLTKIYTFPIKNPENFNPNETGLTNDKPGNVIWEIVDILHDPENTYQEYSIKYKVIYTQQATEEKTLSKTSDDYGDNAYFFRGNVDDNYINFSGMCWRIVKINSDATIKIVLADRTKECSNSISDDNAFVVDKNNDQIIVDPGLRGTSFAFDFGLPLNNWYKKSITKKEYVAEGVFCDNLSSVSLDRQNSDSVYTTEYTQEYYVMLNSSTISNKLLTNFYNPVTFSYYDSSGNLKTVTKALFNSLKCSENANTYNSKISVLSVQEYIFAGAYYWTPSNVETPTYYLLSNINTVTSSALKRETNTGTGGFYNDLYYIAGKKVRSNGNWEFWTDNTLSKSYLRPTINLISDIEVTGSGTINDPYVVTE